MVPVMQTTSTNITFLFLVERRSFRFSFAFRLITRPFKIFFLFRYWWLRYILQWRGWISLFLNFVFYLIWNQRGYLAIAYLSLSFAKFCFNFKFTSLKRASKDFFSVSNISICNCCPSNFLWMKSISNVRAWFLSCKELMVFA